MQLNSEWNVNSVYILFVYFILSCFILFFVSFFPFSIFYCSTFFSLFLSWLPRCSKFTIALRQRSDNRFLKKRTHTRDRTRLEPLIFSFRSNLTICRLLQPCLLLTRKWKSFAHKKMEIFGGKNYSAMGLPHFFLYVVTCSI